MGICSGLEQIETPGSCVIKSTRYLQVIHLRARFAGLTGADTNFEHCHNNAAAKDQQVNFNKALVPDSHHRLRFSLYAALRCNIRYDEVQ